MNSCLMLVASSHAGKRRELRAALELEGHRVAEAATADQTIQKACDGPHEMLVMDWVVDGIAAPGLCRAIRSKSDLGIVVLADDDSKQSRIDTLNSGADDFVPVPFVVAELLARVRAILRRLRRSREEGSQIILQDRAVDLRSHKVRGPDGRVCHLTPKEFLVLQHLVAHADEPSTYQSLAQSVWRRDAGGEIEYLRIVIKQLRRKLEADPDNPRYIHTERSVGYRFHMPALVRQRASAGLSARLSLVG